MEKARETGYGLTYLLIHDEKCLGMGIINHIHHTHLTANLGYWLRPDACAKGNALETGAYPDNSAYAFTGLMYTFK